LPEDIVTQFYNEHMEILKEITKELFKIILEIRMGIYIDPAIII
jgi:hypothetical protein